MAECQVFQSDILAQIAHLQVLFLSIFCSCLRPSCVYVVAMLHSRALSLMCHEGSGCTTKRLCKERNSSSSTATMLSACIKSSRIR